jgi:hypothetical protein
MCWSKYEAERRAEEEERRREEEETLRRIEADAERRAELLLGKNKAHEAPQKLRR